MNRILQRIAAYTNPDDIINPVFFWNGKDGSLFNGFEMLIKEPAANKEDKSTYDHKADFNQKICWIANKYNLCFKNLYITCKKYGLHQQTIVKYKSVMNRLDNYINKIEEAKLNKEFNISELTDVAQHVYKLLPEYKRFNSAVSEQANQMELGGLDILDQSLCDAIKKHYSGADFVSSVLNAKADYKAKVQAGKTKATTFKKFIIPLEKMPAQNEGTHDKRKGVNVSRGYIR